MHAETRRNTPSELHYTMIEERRAGLKTHTHSGPVYLDENIVGEIADQVQVHHP